MTSFSQPQNYLIQSNNTNIEGLINSTGPGVLSVTGDILMRDQSLEERLGTIEKILNIPTRDIAMEEKYPRLKELYIEYTKALEKYKTWEQLKNEKSIL